MEIGHDPDDGAVIVVPFDLSSDDLLRILVAHNMEIRFVDDHGAGGITLGRTCACEQVEAIHAEIVAVREFYLYIFPDVFFAIVKGHGT